MVQEGEDGGQGGAVVRCPDTGPLPPAAGGQAGHRAHLHEAEGGHPRQPEVAAAHKLELEAGVLEPDLAPAVVAPVHQFAGQGGLQHVAGEDTRGGHVAEVT